MFRMMKISALLVLFISVTACVERAEPPLERRGNAVLIEDLPELGGDYPDNLIDGLSRQLIDELNCIEPGVLVEFESRAEPGHLYTENNIPLMLRPEALDAALATARDEGDYLTVTSGYRDAGMQYYDYLRGQRFGFLAARPGGSRHQGGQAIDVDEHRRWRQPLLDHGWRWPLGERDAPHFEYHDLEGDLRPESVRAFQRLWNRNMPDDPIEEDGAWGPITESKMEVTHAEGFVVGGCDLDLDGHASELIGGDDCDDERSDVHPGAVEVCGDGIDQDCSGADLPCEEPDVGSDAMEGQDAERDLPEEDLGVPGDDVAPDSAPVPEDDAGEDSGEGLPEARPDAGEPTPVPETVGSQRVKAGCACNTAPTASRLRWLLRR